MAATYSIWSLLANARGGHRGWPRAWRDPTPKKSYDVVVIGGGGHGLATAYYLAKEHGIASVAVLEKGWLGGGNTGRNTTVIRSNYLFEESAGIYEFSLKLWEGLSRELNFNTMFSQRGVLAVVQDRAGMNEIRRRAAAIELAGIDVEILSPAGVKAWCPILDMASGTRHPILGGLLQRRGGVARHDALAWGFARAADARGVDIIQNCEVTALRRGRSGITGIETTRGAIKAGTR